MNKQNTHSPESGSIFFLSGIAVFILFVLLIAPFSVYANFLEEIAVEEIPLTMKVDKVGTFEIPAVIVGTTAYLSITELFTFLKIKNISSPDWALVKGYFLSPDDEYVIDYAGQKIQYRGNVYPVSDKDLVQTANGLYLSIGRLQDIFSLECTFQFRSLSVFLKSHDQLPLFRELQQEEKRKFLNRMKGETEADTTLDRTRPFLYLGAADWAIYSAQNLNGPVISRANLALGGVLAGGETTLCMNYYTNQPFTNRNLYYRWRHVNNQSKLLRQLTLGKIATSSVSSIFSPVVGAQISNSPTTYRRFFATHTMTDHTEPGWTVELYVNNTLVDYTTADASGFFKFDIPLSYGKTEVELRHYGQWGEERTEIRNIQIPYSFLPKHELEYKISGGVIENDPGRRFFRSSFNYGLTNRMTIGGGYEYLDAAPEAFSIPFLNTSFSLTDHLLFTAEYAHGVKATGLMSFRLPSNLTLDISYTDYVEGQRAIYYNYLEERKVRLSLPVRFKKWATYSRFSYNQLILPHSNHLVQLDHVFTTSYKRLSANLRTYAYLRKNQPATVYSELSTGFRLPKRTTLTPIIRYNHNKGAVTGWKFRAEKPFSRNGNLTITYEESPELGIRNIQIGLRHVFPGVQTSAYANLGNRSSSFTQSASGGVLFDRATAYAKTSSMNKVGRGWITVLPFLDMNSNGVRDENEPKVNGVKVRATPGGRMEVDKQDTLVRIFDLEPYTSIFLELNGDGLENIAWQLHKKSFRVPVEPNLMKLVEVPVSVVAEVSGSVRVVGSDARRPGRFKIDIFREDHSLVNSIYSEDDGYYNYLGLPPGNYTIQMDSAQLANQQLVSQPASREVNILPDYYGFFIDELDFMLQIDAANIQVVDEMNRNSLPVQPDGIVTDSVSQTEGHAAMDSSAISGNPQVWFSIQVFVANSSFDTESPVFQDERGIHELKLGRHFKYYSGKYQDFEVAWSEMFRLRKKFHGAFIVAFRDSQLLIIDNIVLKSGAPRRHTVPEKVSQSDSTRQEIWYAVQIAAMTTRIHIPTLFKGETDIQEQKIGNHYKYFVGRFNDYQQALNARQELHAKFPEAFIIGFKGMEQVPIDAVGNRK